MEDKEMILRQERPSVLVQACKIVQTRPDNFIRVPDAQDLRYMGERPMMLNMWTQTYAEDFHHLNEHQQSNLILKLESDQNNKTENECILLEKIRILEETLRNQSELLEQIHNTSGRQSASLQKYQPNYNNIQQYNLQTDASMQHQICKYTQYKSNKLEDNILTSTRESPTSSLQMDPSPAIMNSVISNVHTVVDSIKYTIIAEGKDDEHGTPIEIALAADNRLNLNSSTESNRLEICFDSTSPESPQPHEMNKTNNNKTDQDEITKKLPLKRRRIKSKNNENDIPDKLTPVYTYNNDDSYMREKQTKLSDEKIKNTSTPKTKYNILNENKNNNGNINIKNYNNNNNNNNDEDVTLVEKMVLRNDIVSIGPNNTRIPARLYECMNWKSASIATRKLLMAVFDRHTLATHSMTGKPSPAFKDHGKPMKEMLNPKIIQDIIFAVTRKCNVSDKQVRNAITTKCADENKMMKMQINKRLSLNADKENRA